MNKFINLLDFELGRFLKYLLPTFAVVAVLQFYTIFSTIIEYNNQVDMHVGQGLDLSTMERFSGMNITQSALFSLSIMGLVLVFVFYSFFVWYREWLGKNAFIYRLLMLPVKRSYIFLTKSLVFLIGGFLSFVFQFGMYGLVLLISEQMIQPELYQALSIHEVQPLFDGIQHVLFPETGHQFLMYYGFAFGALITLFTAILIERTYQLKGLLVGVILFIAYFVLYGLIASSHYMEFISFISRPSQAYIATIIYLGLVILSGTWFSNRLLKNKIKV